MTRSMSVAALLMILIGGGANAATLTATTDKSVYVVGETITIDVTGDSQGGQKPAVYARLEWGGTGSAGFLNAYQQQITSYRGNFFWNRGLLSGDSSAATVLDQFGDLAPLPVDGLIAADLTLQAAAAGDLNFGWDGSTLQFFGASGVAPSTVTIIDPPPLDLSQLQSDPSCPAAPGGGAAASQTPTLLATLADLYHGAWLGSPAVADLDGDGENEIVATRHNLLTAWHLDGSIVFQTQSNGSRFYAPPVIADLDPTISGLELAAVADDELYAWDASGQALDGFPVSWRSELRAVAAHDIDGDAKLELVVVTTDRLSENGQSDIVMAYEVNGQPVAGFPPNTTGTSNCDGACYVFGGFGQTLALGDLDSDDEFDIVAPHDNAYLSVHHGSGVMYDASSIFSAATKVAGVRGLLDYAEAQQGYSLDEDISNQSHHTVSAPAIADIDGNGTMEIILLGSVQNASQTDRERGVALFVLNPDGTRPPLWESPYHASTYLSGLYSPGGTNLLRASNEVAIADLDATASGLEMVFAAFDGKIHAVGSDRQLLWTYAYTADPDVLTSGVVIADLSGDGEPEVIFATYSVDVDDSDLFVLGADGALQHKLALPGHGVMPVPTVADVDLNGTLEIVLSYKNAVNLIRQVEVYTVTGSQTNCMPWPTGRGNLARTGSVPEPGSTAMLLAGCALLHTFGSRRRRG